MNKEKVFAWIESLEDMADQSDKYFVERTELYRENQEKDKEIERLNNVINEANKCILEFIQTEDYNRVDGLAIADNYMRLMQILETKIEENNK